MNLAQYSEITVKNAHQVLAEVQAACAKGDALLCFQGVRHVDSSGLTLLLHARRALPSPLQLRIQNPPPALQKLIQTHGVAELFAEQFPNSI